MLVGQERAAEARELQKAARQLPPIGLGAELAPQPSGARTPGLRGIGPFAWRPLGAAVVAIGAVVVVQIDGTRREPDAFRLQPRPVILRATERTAGIVGPEFHADEPPEEIELGPPELETSVHPVFLSPISHSSQAVSDLISLA